MNNFIRLDPKAVFIITMGGILIALLGWHGATYGHGGKTHEDNTFTALKALQKATALYDKLLSDGKLDASWETQLADIAISARKRNGRDEIAVAFQRAEGSPAAVFIFFTAQGEYAGSNFSGQ